MAESVRVSRSLITFRLTRCGRRIPHLTNSTFSESSLSSETVNISNAVTLLNHNMGALGSCSKYVESPTRPSYRTGGFYAWGRSKPSWFLQYFLRFKAKTTKGGELPTAQSGSRRGRYGARTQGLAQVDASWIRSPRTTCSDVVRMFISSVSQNAVGGVMSAGLFAL